HTHGSSRVPMEKADPIIRRHIDLHAKYFPRTLLCISDDIVGHARPVARAPLNDYPLSKGVSLRDDSIMVQPPPRSWFHAKLAQQFWPRLPVILEHQHYGPAKKREAWDPALLQKAVDDYHAAYLSIHWWPRILLEENRAAIDRINRRLGYRLQLRAIAWPVAVVIGKRFAVTSTWANAGVAPCYPGGYLTLTLKDEKKGLVAVLADETLEMRTLKVGPPGKAPVKAHTSSFTVGRIAPATKPGTCDVYVSVGRRDGTPAIALPLKGGDGRRRYKLGRIVLRAP
ncbi:MAG: DUF4832 domain-containing protein, partial [Candidatus Hydrogenedentes bacterium]|nr:DUF4832 domain-containing protein [Candidatus Hydrogenedentota bacterium]